MHTKSIFVLFRAQKTRINTKKHTFVHILSPKIKIFSDSSNIVTENNNIINKISIYFQIFASYSDPPVSFLAGAKKVNFWKYVICFIDVLKNHIKTRKSRKIISPELGPGT